MALAADEPAASIKVVPASPVFLPGDSLKFSLILKNDTTAPLTLQRGFAYPDIPWIGVHIFDSTGTKWYVLPKRAAPVNSSPLEKHTQNLVSAEPGTETSIPLYLDYRAYDIETGRGEILLTAGKYKICPYVSGGKWPGAPVRGISTTFEMAEPEGHLVAEWIPLSHGPKLQLFRNGRFAMSEGRSSLSLLSRGTYIETSATLETPPDDFDTTHQGQVLVWSKTALAGIPVLYNGEDTSMSMSRKYLYPPTADAELLRREVSKLREKLPERKKSAVKIDIEPLKRSRQQRRRSR